MSPPLRVLIVDDERISRLTTAQQLKDAGYVAETAENAFVGFERLNAQPFDVVLTDLRMPTMDGLEFLRELKRTRPDVDVILMTAFGSVTTAVSAMHEGAADYLTKPFQFQELAVRLRRLAQARESRGELVRLRALLGEHPVGGIVSRSPAMAQVLERVRLFADHAAPVLITGETGTGKEVVARAIHHLGPRQREPFVGLSCGAIPRDLAESQLFGHEKGAFTGAVQRRRGSFEQAHGGTLLLDDVDDLPLDLQVKLLRVLQEGTLVRVGGEQPITVDTRIIATTKVDLAHANSERTFRTDLLYRLRGLEISLPPLRDRGDDVLLLAHHFLRLIAAGEGAAPKSISVEAADVLRRYAWPGNVRELCRVMESAVALSPADEIRGPHLPVHVAGADAASPLFTLHLDGVAHVDLPDLVRRFEDEVVKWALRSGHGQQAQSAELLGIPRTTLQSKLGRPR